MEVGGVYVGNCELLLLWKCDENLGKKTFKQTFQALEQI